MIIFGFNPANITWHQIYVAVYVILSIFFVVYGTNKLYATGQTRGVIFAVGVSLVLMYFGVRWFGKGSDKPKKWPPVVNMCPDYLTYVPSLPGCVDMLGVSTNGNMTISMPSDLPTLQISNTQRVFEYTSPDVKAATTASALQAICDRCKNAGVTWEGVYDGDSCVGISRVAADAAAQATCASQLYDDAVSGLSNLI